MVTLVSALIGHTSYVPCMLIHDMVKQLSIQCCNEMKHCTFLMLDLYVCLQLWAQILGEIFLLIFTYTAFSDI